MYDAGVAGYDESNAEDAGVLGVEPDEILVRFVGRIDGAVPVLRRGGLRAVAVVAEPGLTLEQHAIRAPASALVS